MSIIEPKASTCSHCDFGSGHRGMDWCSRCDGTGSVFLVLVGDKVKGFPNTKKGYQEAVYVLNDPELSREKA